jgi:hypothetical protein
MTSQMIDITKLRSPQNFANEKGVSRQLIYVMMAERKLDTVDIDGTRFIILNKKALDYKRTK